MLRKNVGELMSGAKSVDFVQPWYRCVRTCMENTGMSLGGIGSAITTTPAGNTPFFHFYNGCAIGNEEESEDTVEFLNYFYAESSADDFTLTIRSPTFFYQDCNAFPLYDPQGRQYLYGRESYHDAGRIFDAIIHDKDLVENNYDNLKAWCQNRQVDLDVLLQANDDRRVVNRAILLTVYAMSLARPTLFTRSLIGDTFKKMALNKPCYPSKKMIYEFNYPISLTHYKEETQLCHLRKTHITLMCPGNEMLCSLPAFLTHFKLKNPTQEAVEISLVLSIENVVGYQTLKSRPGAQDALMHFQKVIDTQAVREFKLDAGEKTLHGMALYREDNGRKCDIEGELGFAVSYREGDLKVTVNKGYYKGSEANIVDAALASGTINDLSDATTHTGKEAICGGLCISAKLLPDQELEFEVISCFDLPAIDADTQLSKKYTEYFPQASGRVEQISSYIARNRNALYDNEYIWRESTHYDDVFDGAHLSHSARTKLKQMSLDSYSFLPEASVWSTEGDFLIRECVDYPFFNSLDVYFYGSFGLLRILPKIDNEIIRKFREVVESDIATSKTFGEFARYEASGINHELVGQRHVKNTVPHDMGSPFDWGPNAYHWKDVSNWQDLAPKYILLIYRNYRVTRDTSLLQECWASIQGVIEQYQTLCRANNLPWSDGCNTTFDNLPAYGISIYASSLWIASLKAAAKIAQLLRHDAEEAQYTAKALEASKHMVTALWDDAEGYYLYSVRNICQEDLIDASELSQLDVQCKAQLKQLASEIDPHFDSSESNLNPEQVCDLLNGYISDDMADVVECLKASLDQDDRSRVGSDSLQLEYQRLAKVEKRSIKKRAVHSFLNPIFKVKEFSETGLDKDDDGVFADQLCADMYLSYLDLDPITSSENQRRSIGKILNTNRVFSSDRIGASNMVSKRGADCDNFQAQDIWIGVQFSIASLMVQNNMLEEFESYIEILYDAIYEKAKIPFGIPEGFHCSGLFIAEDLSRSGTIKHNARVKIIEKLKELDILDHSNHVNFEFVNSIKGFKKWWKKESGGLDRHVSGGDLLLLLESCKLKYTAGRYLRAGMVNLIPELLRKHLRSEQSGAAQQESSKLEEA
jgi:non-lysosomal glucosylceramidase